MRNTILLFALAMLGLFSAGCNSGGGLGGNNPEKVLEKFLFALEKKDVEEAGKYVTKDSEPFMNMIKMGISMSGESEKKDDLLFKGEKPVIGKASIDGDKATVPVSNQAGDQTSNFVLKKESGDWKVAFDKATIMQMSGEQLQNNHPDSLDNLKQEDIEEAMNAMKNLSKEDMDKAVKAMDSLKDAFNELNKDGKLDQIMEDAGKMMEQMQKRTP